MNLDFDIDRTEYKTDKEHLLTNAAFLNDMRG